MNPHMQEWAKVTWTNFSTRPFLDSTSKGASGDQIWEKLKTFFVKMPFFAQLNNGPGNMAHQIYLKYGMQEWAM